MPSDGPVRSVGTRWAVCPARPAGIINLTTRGMTCSMAYPGDLAVDLPDHDPWEKENHGCFVSS